MDKDKDFDDVLLEKVYKLFSNTQVKLKNLIWDEWDADYSVEMVFKVGNRTLILRKEKYIDDKELE